MSLKSKFKQYALGTLVLAVAAPLYFGGKHWLAKPAGEVCDAQTSCRGNNILFSGMCFQTEAEAAYCSHECNGASDCPTDMTCEAVDGTWTTETTRGNHASQTSTTKGTKMVCVKP